MSFKSFLVQALLISLLSGAVFSIHFIPNRYCVAAFNLPCDATQDR